ncbi:MAG: beta strand repeat-containing protein [Candidatus Margulisiibacteriota bacterium]
MLFSHIAQSALTADTATTANTALSVAWGSITEKPTLVTPNYSGTITATAFVGDGSQLTGLSTAGIDDGSITSAKIADATIVNADISPSASIAYSKLNISKADIVGLGIPTADTTYTAGTGLGLSGTAFAIDGTVVTSNFHGSVTATAFVGDGSQLTGLSTAGIDDGSITSAKIADGTIVNADISTSAAIGYSKLALATSITNSDISPTASIAYSKLNIAKADIVGLGIPTADTTYTAGTGLSLSGTSFSINGTVVTSNFNGTVTATAFVGDGSQLTGVSTSGLDNGSVTGTKIASGTITSANISSTAGILGSQLANGTITNTQIADFTIDANRLDSDSVSSSKIQDGSVETEDIADGAIVSTKIAAGTITSANISATAAIPYSKLNLVVLLGNMDLSPTASIAYSKLSLSGSVVNSDISSLAAIAYSKLNLANSIALTDLGTTAIVTSNYTGSLNLSGTVTANVFVGDGSRLTGVVATSLDDSTVTSAKIVDDTITNSDINSAAGIAYSKLNLAGSVVNSDISSSAGIAYSKLNLANSIGVSDLGSTAIVTSNYTGNLNVSGTVTANAFIGNGAGLTGVVATDLADSTVTSAKIVDGAITDEDISTTAAIPYSKLNLTSSIMNADVSPSAGIAYSKLNLTASVTNADIAAGAAIAFTKLQIAKSDITDLGIPGDDTDTIYSAGTGLNLNGTTFSINSGVVTSNYTGGLNVSGTVTANAFIGDGSGLTGVPVDNNSVTSAKIVDGSILTEDIADSAITGDKIADGTIDYSKLTGTIPSNQLPGNVVTANFNGSLIVSSTISGASFSGSGAGLTNVVTSNYALSPTINGQLNAVGGISTGGRGMKFASGRCESNALVNQSQVTSINHDGTGVYTITLAFTATNIIPVATLYQLSPGYVSVTNIGSNSFVINTYDSSGTNTDADFSFLVIGY